MTLPALCRASSKMCTMPSAAIRRSDTRALSSSKRNTPGRWPIERHHTCPPQGVHSNALVNDVQREFAGAEAIRAFAAKEIFGDRVTFTPLWAVNRHGDITVHARTDGTYDKTGLPDPLILSLYFSLRDERITQLIIIHNRALA